MYKNNDLIKDKISKIKMILFDVDGVFTDGSVYLTEKGEEMLKFSRVDGKGIELLRKKGYLLGIISSEESEIVRKRMDKLKIKEVYLGIKNKLKIYNELKSKYNLKDEEVCYCGDDIQDIVILKKVGLACCPDNAQEEVKKVCGYISNKKGGNEFVRQLANLILDKNVRY